MDVNWVFFQAGRSLDMERAYGLQCIKTDDIASKMGTFGFLAYRYASWNWRHTHQPGPRDTDGRSRHSDHTSTSRIGRRGKRREYVQEQEHKQDYFRPSGEYVLVHSCRIA